MANDYFLTKIYETLGNKPFSHSKKPITPPKKFQSLNEVYHQVTLKQINEDTDILMQQKGDNNVEEFTVTDDVAKQIRLEINKETIKKIIDDVLKSKKWNEGAENYSNLLNEVLNIFSSKKINSEEIKEYVNLVNKDKSVTENILTTNKQKPISLKSIIPEWFNNFFEDKNGVDVASKLWDLRFKQKNMVGKGELMFTLISDCRKGDKDSVGDLFFDTLGSIEVKGLSGKMGGDGFVNTNTSKLLNDIFTEKQETLKEIPQLSSQIINLVKNSIFKILDNIIKDTKRKKPLNLKEIEEIKTKIDNLESYEEIEQLMNQVGFKQLEKDSIDREIKNYLKKKRTYRSSDLSSNNEKMDVFKNDYAHSLEAFFTSYLNLSDEQLVKGILACRSYSKMLPKDFINYIEEEVASKKDYYFSGSTLTKNLINIIAALHTVEYQEDKKFNGFVFMNDINKNMIYYSFEKESSFTEKFKLFYNFLNTSKPRISISMSEQQKSVNIAFTRI